MYTGRGVAPFTLSAFIAASALAVLMTPRALPAQTTPEKPLVYNHITQGGAAFDKLVHRKYDAEFTVVDFADRDGVFIPAQPLSGLKPEAPVDEKGVPIRGKVIVFFIVTTEGRAVKPVIVESSDSRLSSAVLSALAVWVFEPARVNGKQAATTAGEAFEFPMTP